MSGSSNPSRLKRAFTISLAIAVTAGMAFAMQYAEYQGVFANAEGFALTPPDQTLAVRSRPRDHNDRHQH